mmetsp:Transcript_6239/g.15436  ORF Transcript_6239/g.15436 Transcript_6239/m.15436 type:complete len:550 (-) Transcript_6239:75-1724(-)
MANFFDSFIRFTVFYHVLIRGLFTGDENNHHGIGVSAFFSKDSHLRSTSPSVPTTNVKSPFTRVTVTDPGYSPSLSPIFAKDPTKKQQYSKSTFITTFVKNDSNSNERSSTPSTDVPGVFALLLISQFLLFIGVGAVIPCIPLYGKEIGLSGAANGLVISAPAVALFLGANWSGRRADIARKPAMMIGMAVIAVSDIGTACAQGIYSLVLARLGLGAGRALSEAGERGMLVDLANQIPELRGRALAAQQAVVALGIAIGAPTGGVLIEKYGPRAAFLCVSAAAITALVLYAFLPETVVRSSSSFTTVAIPSKEVKKLEDADSEEVLNENTAGVKVWVELLKKNDWKGLTLCQSGSSFGFAAKIASIPILAASILPGGAIGSGTLLSAAGLSGLVGAPIGGYVTDRIGAKGAAVASGLISSVGLILVPFALQFADDGLMDGVIKIQIGSVLLQTKALCFSLAVLIWSFGVSAQGPALNALAQEKSLPGVEATSLSLLRASGDGTYIIAPLILGSIADTLTEYPGIECALAGSTTLMGTVALYFLAQQGDS